MIDDSTAATSAEVCALAGFTKQRLGALERDGIVQRNGRDSWPLVTTIRKIFEDMRAKRNEASAADARWRNARARDQEIKTAQRLGKLVDVDEIYFAMETLAGLVRSEHVSLAARCTRDLALRRAIDLEVNAMDTRIADKLEALAKRLSPREPP